MKKISITGNEVDIAQKFSLPGTIEQRWTTKPLELEPQTHQMIRNDTSRRAIMNDTPCRANIEKR